MLSDDTGVDTLGQHGGNNHDDAIEWSPHPKLLKSNINIMNVPGDGNCMLHACTSKLQNLLNIRDFTIQQAINMRNVLMDHLLSHASYQTENGMTLSELAMLRASEIELELKKNPLLVMQSFLLLMTMLITCDLLIRIDASMQTHRNYI